MLIKSRSLTSRFLASLLKTRRTWPCGFRPLSTSSESNQRLQSRRIVVTGMGAVTPIGATLKDSWNNLVLNDNEKFPSAVVTLEDALRRQQLPEEMLEAELEFSRKLPCQIAAPADFEKAYDHRMSRFIQLALRASDEALEQAGLHEWFGKSKDGSDRSDDNPEIQLRRERTGVCIGSAMSSVRQVFHATQLSSTARGYRKLSPYFVSNCLSNSAAARVAMQYGLRGPNHSASTACAAGGHAIGDAFRCLDSTMRSVDIMLCGGTESCIDPLSMAGFCRLQALATSFNDNPGVASRPFDINRNGFVMAEGAAVLVLEDLEHALKRNAPVILAELTGYSLSGDAFHVTAPDPNFKGAQTSIRQAMQQHRYNGNKTTAKDEGRGQMCYVNAHATSTPKGDEIEAQCVYSTLNNGYEDMFSSVHVSSTKGATGHLLGAAGALEAAFSVNALHTQKIPPTKNLETIDPTCEFDKDSNFHHVRNSALHLNADGCDSLELAISNSFGFGGTNSCLVFRRYRPEADK